MAVKVAVLPCPVVKPATDHAQMDASGLMEVSGKKVNCQKMGLESKASCTSTLHGMAHLHEYKCYDCSSGPDLLSAFLEEDYPALLLQALRHKVGTNKEEETAKIQM